MLIRSRFGIVPVIVIPALIAIVLSACAGPARDSAGPVTVAVWNPEAIGPMTGTQSSMADMFAARILDQYGQSPGYAVVERESLLNVLQEQHLGSSQLADEQTRLKLGRIIGCRQMVFGAYQVIGSLMRLDLRTVDVSSGKILKTATGTAPADSLGNWLDTADQAAKDLIKP